LNVVYTCTEDIEENGKILAYEINPDGSLLQIGEVDAGGTSTCYLTIDREQRNLIAVNYWDSSLVVIPLSKSTGEFTGPIHSVYDPRQGKAMMAAAKKHGGVNHSNNDESTIAQRQVDPHSHALVLDPFEGCVAYVPDLGKDLVREFWYDKESGRIGCEINTLPSGLSTGKPDGPRYFEFHPKFNVAYVVNELSSTVSISFLFSVIMMKPYSPEDKKSHIYNCCWPNSGYIHRLLYSQLIENYSPKLHVPPSSSNQWISSRAARL